MKKYRIVDEDGEKYEVEEMEVEEAPAESRDEDEDVVLTVDEIVAIKRLLPYIDKIMAMVEEPTEDAVEEVAEGEEEEVEEPVEEVVETEDKKTCDSKRSLGAIESRKQTVDDSLTDDVSAAWAKRFNGGK